MKGIILAGGLGSRLYPITKCISKQLLPIYDKPMIYYPLSILMLSGIKEIVIISTPRDLPRFEELFKDGSNIGMQFKYIIQPSPNGLAESFILSKDFIGDDDACLILGDNIFHGQGITKILLNAVSNAKDKNLATIFAYHVNNPEDYGVIDFDIDGKARSIEEKPVKPKSNYAVTGLYFYPNDVIKKAFEIVPSDRGELEITSLNQMYLDEGRLSVELMAKGYTWLDAGTHDSLLEAGQLIKTIEKSQSLKVGCLEEIAYKMGYIPKEQLQNLAKIMTNNQYSKYLINLANKIK